MLEFYKKAILIFSGLGALIFVMGLVCLNRVFIRDALLPAQYSVLPWKLEIITDMYRGGASSISINDSSSSLDYDYVLREDVQYPHVTAIIAFAELKTAEHPVDLSGYSAVTFKVKCVPRNILAFHLHSLDPRVADPGNFYSYRIAEASFSCGEEWSDVAIDLRYLNVPDWWLQRFKMEISDKDYRLDKVMAFSIVASHKRLVNTPAKIKINGLTLHGRDWRYAGTCVGIFVFVWACFIVWLFKQYIRSLITDIKDKLRKDRPLRAYQQLSIGLQQDSETSSLMRFVATEYANPGLSLEKTITTLGINRTKINEILKKELGFTFTAYLNKLRLAEAARLLSETENANVSEIAYSVGYNNVTYFNKLFKNEYGCTPKTFKRVCRRQEALDDGQSC